ncbi:MAG: HAD-IA family hydrolase [Nanoarchaeota archaeon]
MIRTLIFDFAGVITTSAMFPRVAEVLGKRTGMGKEAFMARLKTKEKEYLLGECTTKEYWEDVCHGTSIPYADFVQEISWYQVNDDLLDLLKGLKGRYELVLLSDNYDALLDAISHDKNLEGIFAHTFYSNQLHMTKMHDSERIFAHALKALHAEADECVFIDDKADNLAPAKKLGIRTIHFKDVLQLKRDLATYGVALD